MIIKEVTVDFATGVSRIIECYNFELGTNSDGKSAYLFKINNDKILSVPLTDLNNANFDIKYRWEFPAGYGPNSF